MLYHAVWGLLLALAAPAAAPEQSYRPDRAPLSTAVTDTVYDEAREDAARAAWDERLRTSDDDPARARDWRRRPAQDYPRDKERVGCICMDGSFSESTGRGACSTRGGVRYWVYAYAGGDTLHWATPRHRAHPEALNQAELSQLAAHNPDLKAKKTARDKTNFWDFALASLGAGSLLVGLRLLLRSNVLHVFIHPPGGGPHT